MAVTSYREPLTVATVVYGSLNAFKIIIEGNVLNGKVILVTGGTGSFDMAFVKTVLEKYKPEKLIRDISKPGGMPRKLLDSIKINSLAWRPQTALCNGIKEAYQDFLAGNRNYGIFLSRFSHILELISLKYRKSIRGNWR